MSSLIKNQKIGLALIGLTLLVSIGCKETRIEPLEVMSTIASTEKDIAWLDYRLNLEHWKVLSGQSSDSLEFFQALQREYFRRPEHLNILKSNKTRVKGDEVALRKYDLLIGRLLTGYVESSPGLGGLRDSIRLLNAANPPRIGSEVYSQDQLDLILAFGSDPTRRELAFRASYAGREAQTEMMGQLIRRRNQEAARLGYNDYFAMIFPTDGISLEKYRQLLDNLEDATAAPYQTILDRIGTGQVEPWDLLYKLSADLRMIYDRPTIDSQWSVIRRSFGDLGYNLDQLPIYMELSTSPNDPAQVIGLTINAPHDQRLIGNLGSGTRLTGQVFRAIARLIHTTSISETEPLFVAAVDGAWTEGVAELLGSIVNDSLWLARYMNLSPTAIATIEKAQRELNLVQVRMLLLKLNFEYEAYRSRKPDLNLLYWDLSNRIMRLVRHDDLAPWASNMELVEHPITGQNKLLGQVIAAQTRAYLIKVNGGVVGNPETRSFLLQNYLRFGARYSWSELLERGTGEKLNHEFLVQALINQ